MAININVLPNNKGSLGQELVYSRLDNQTPLDFAVTYLDSIEDLFEFYSKFKLANYEDFYLNPKYRISNVSTDMREGGYESATGNETIGN